MASAVLASRNEAHWGESKAFMRNYTKTPIPITSANNNFPHFSSNPNPNPNSNPRLNPNPNFSHGRQQIHEHAVKRQVRQNNELPHSVAVPSTVEFQRKSILGNAYKDAFHREYVTFDLASYSKSELRELKKRLVSDLGRVRGLLNRIETRELESRAGFEASRGHAFESGVAQPEPQLHKVEQHQRGSDFESKKVLGQKRQGKNKKVLGNKRHNATVVPSGRDSKRLAVGAPALEVSPVDKVVAAMMKKCKQILTKVMKNKAAWWFNTPVDVDGLKLYDYYQVIKHPMDLGTVKSNLEKNVYETPSAFAADVSLTFKNAMTYNPKGHEVHSMAEKFLSMFDQMFDPAFKKFEAEYASVVANFVDLEQVNVNQMRPTRAEPKTLPRALSELPPVPVKSNADLMNLPPALLNSSEAADAGVLKPMLKSGKLPKPKARDPNKRPMTYEEKANLGENLQELPPEKAEQMVQIVRRRNPNLMQEGDEIELDIESLDNETLWELEKFVAHHKKVVSKMKRQQLFENMSSAPESNKSPDHEAIPDGGGQKNKRGDAPEEDVDIGEEIPVCNFPPVEIEKDVAGASSASSSSSSSSSSSGSSSSSDSGSGSSSGSESDEDSVQSPFVEPKEARVA